MTDETRKWIEEARVRAVAAGDMGSYRDGPLPWLSETPQGRFIEHGVADILKTIALIEEQERKIEKAREALDAIYAMTYVPSCEGGILDKVCSVVIQALKEMGE